MPSERAALIAAILAAPQDDAVRLVCADWFEEQGDEASVARADFIRTQVRRARLAPDDAEQSELQARELRLLKSYGPAWCGSHFVFKKVRFQRGFVEYVHLHLTHFLHHRRQMFELEPVRAVRLTGWHRAPAELARRVGACEEWRHVETLHVHHQGPHKSPRGDVVDLLESPHLTRLRSLQMPSLVDFDEQARRRFERLDVLRHVEALTLPELEDYPNEPGEWFSDGGEELPHRWERLRSLVVPYDAATDDLLRLLMGSPFWQRLTALDVPMVPEGQSERFLAALPSGLTDFKLGSIGGWPQALGAVIDALARVPLRRLRLVGLGDVDRFCTACDRWSLQELVFTGGAVPNGTAERLAEAPGLRGLNSLSLTVSATNEDGSDLRALLGGGLPSLTALHLAGSRLSAAAAREVARDADRPRLRGLHLLRTQTDEPALRELLAAPQMRELVWLSAGAYWRGRERVLTWTPELVASLARLPHLSWLWLTSQGMSAPGAEQAGLGGRPAWVTLVDDANYDQQRYRALFAPERTPPIERELEDVVRPTW